MQEVVILTALRVDAELVAAPSGSTSAASSADRRPGRSSTTRAGSGRSRSSSGCSQLGADPAAPSGADFDTPLDWVVHGSQYHGLSDRDYVGIAERLVAAGAPPVAKYPEAAEGPLAEWLQRMSIASPNE